MFLGSEMRASLIIPPTSFKYRLHTKSEVAKSLGNQARGVQPACTMTTQNSKIRLISSIALKSRLITINLLLANLIGQFKLVIVQDHSIATKYTKCKVNWPPLGNKILSGVVYYIYTKRVHLGLSKVAFIEGWGVLTAGVAFIRGSTL